MFKGIFIYFIKGFSSFSHSVLPYHVKNPYEDASHSLLRDWKFISKDIKSAINKYKNEK